MFTQILEQNDFARFREIIGSMRKRADVDNIQTERRREREKRKTKERADSGHGARTGMAPHFN